MDVWLVAILQLAAFAGGLYAGYVVRPAFIAVLPMRATLVRANEILLQPIPPADSIKPSPWSLRVVAVDDPPNEQARSDLLLEVLDGAPDIDYRPAFYRPIEPRMDLLLESAVPLTARLVEAPQLAPAYTAWLEKRGLTPGADIRVYPMAGTKHEVELLLDAQTRRVLGYFAAP